MKSSTMDHSGVPAVCIRPCARLGLALTPASHRRGYVDKVSNVGTLTVGRAAQAVRKTGSWLPEGKPVRPSLPCCTTTSNKTKLYVVPWSGLAGALITWIVLSDTTGLDLKEQER